MTEHSTAPDVAPKPLFEGAWRIDPVVDAKNMMRAIHIHPKALALSVLGFLAFASLAAQGTRNGGVTLGIAAIGATTIYVAFVAIIRASLRRSFAATGLDVRIALDAHGVTEVFERTTTRIEWTAFLRCSVSHGHLVLRFRARGRHPGGAFLIPLAAFPAEQRQDIAAFLEDAVRTRRCASPG